jgi:ParB family chromosome partitioning protein
VLEVSVSKISPNPQQPRKRFDTDAIKSLSESIAQYGVLQPILITPVGGDDSGEYEIVAGERRWRAAQKAGLLTIPAIIKAMSTQAKLEAALIENLQREDLNPIERAEAFRRLVQEFNMTHQEVAESVGLDRTSVSNHLRLNELDDDTKSAVRKGILSLGHAKALLALANNNRRRAAAQQAIARGWSVRELERRVRVMVENPSANHDSAVGSRDARTVPPHMADLQKRLAAHLGTKVSIRPGRTKNAGTLMIEFFDLDQFEGLLERLQFEMD